jgi:replicative DNA helicase
MSTSRPEGDRKKGRGNLVVLDLGGRTPPHNLDAEAAVLAAILTDGSRLDAVAPCVKAEDFYSDANRRIFEAALELQRRGMPIDVQTIAAWLQDRDWLQGIGGITYLAQMFDGTPAVAHADEYAKIVHDKARVRRLIDTCQVLAAEGFGDYGYGKEFIDRAEQRIYDLAHEEGQSGDAVQIWDAVHEVFARVVRNQEAGRVITGVPTGFEGVDQATRGMHDGQLIVIGARPGMGKTAYLTTMAVNVASYEPPEPESDTAARAPRYAVALFSLEMPRVELTSRMIATEAKVDIVKYEQGIVPEGGHDRLMAAAARISGLPIFIDEASGIGMLDIRSRVRRLQRQLLKVDAQGRVTQKLGFVGIDYLQMMKGREEIRDREQQIADLSRSAKQLAKDLRIPVVLLSQLNRNVESRSKEEREPQLSDLRESGAIEQDADVIQFIYRPEYYVADKRSEKAQKLKGFAKILIAKQRNGPTKTVAMTFIEEFTRFENRARGAYEGDDA